jgi:hypothetical protein
MSPEGGPTVLGTTLFSKGHATPFIRLWLGAAEAVANGSDAEGQPFRMRPREERNSILLAIMGVALAHELAHYLLDTAHHSPGGLLRASLSVRELEHADPARLGLTVQQQRLICSDGDRVGHR